MSYEILIIFVCSYLAFTLSAICGGGASLILMPVIGSLVPVKLVPAALSIGTFTSSGSRLWFFYHHVSWHVVKYFVPPALLAVTIGAYLLKFMNPLYIEMMMGLFLVGNVPYLFTRKIRDDVSMPVSNAGLTAIGFCAGFLSGLTGAVGLLFNRFYLRHGLSKEQIIATRAANEMVLHLIKFLLYSLMGLISAKALYLGLAIAASSVISSWSLKWVLPLLNMMVFKKIGYSAMVLSGFLLLFQSGRDMLTLNRGDITARPIARGLETKIQWQNANYALEFKYDEGFEFEQVIPFSTLNTEQQNFVRSKKMPGDRIVVEEVYSIGEKTFEAYYYSGKRLRNKIDFN